VAQVEQGENGRFLERIYAWRFSFFDNDEGKITHVGILDE
jgi:hypothetical protein